MSIFEMIAKFSFYGMDVMLMASLTCLTIQLLKVTVLRRVQRKIFTFLPFLLGTAMYAGYGVLVHRDFAWVMENYVTVCEHGFAIGTAATMLYVMYEQFIRQKTELTATEQMVATLLDGYVAESKVNEAAKKISAAIAHDEMGNGAEMVIEVLSSYVKNAGDGELKLLAKLIIDTIANVMAK